MKAILLLLVVPCLVVADTLCPDSNISCPDNKRCCEVDGQLTCCDIYDDVGDVHILEGKMKVYAGEEPLQQIEQYPNTSINVQNSMFSSCNVITCFPKKCCNSNFCCPFSGKSVCCLENRCCPAETKCCPVGCCGKRQDCCAGGCCKESQRCCGSWCCKKKEQCGVNLNSCYGSGVSFTPAIATVLLLAAAAVMSRHL